MAILFLFVLLVCAAEVFPDSSSDSGCESTDVATLYVTMNGNPFSGSCEEFIAEYGANICYYDVASTPCCVACSAYATGIVNCEYGDRAPAYCSSTPDVCATENAQYCCQTCN